MEVALAGATYGASLYLLPLAGLLLSWWAARKASPDYLVYPLITSSVLFLDVSGFIISEGHLAAAFFWPLLYLLIFSVRLTVIRSLVLIGLAVSVTRMYECYIVLSWPLILVSLQRGRRAWNELRYGELFVCSGCCLLFLIAFFISLGSVVTPQDSGSRANFTLSILLHLVYPPVWFSLLAIALTLWCILWPDQQSGQRTIRRVLVGCGLFVMLLPLVGIVIPPLNYIARVQFLYLPLVMGTVVSMKAMFSRTNSSCTPSQQIELWRLSAGVCVVAVVFQLGSTYRWDCYRTTLLDELSEQHGVISYDQSAVSVPEMDRIGEREGREAVLQEIFNHPLRFASRMKLCQFDWGWATPSLCVALSALNRGSISAIVSAPKSTGWQPFDPRKIESIPNLSRYGVTIDLETGDGPR